MHTYFNHNISCITPVVVEDVCLVSEGRDGGQYGFFVHPGESVTLPFKYQCFNHPPNSNYEDMAVEDRDVKADSGNKFIKVCWRVA